LAVALATRLVGPGAAPLAPDEARLALDALAAARGEGWPLTTSAPLLLVVNAALFLFAGGGPALARLLPALAGTALVALPLLWRRRIGDAGSLAAALLLCLSPIALFASRRVDGAVVGALAAGLALTPLFVGGRRSALFLGAGVALGSISGPTFYDLLVPGLAAWAFFRWASPDGEDLPPSLLRGLAGGVAVALLLGAGFGLRWGGWAAPGETLGAWLTAPRWDASLLPALALYEPLTLLLALAGSVVAWLGDGRELPSPNPSPFRAARRAFGTSFSLVVWALLAALLAGLRSGGQPPALLAPVLPLALLAGWAAERLFAGLRSSEWMEAPLHVAMSLLFWVFTGMALVRHANLYVATGTELILIALVLVIQVVLAAGFSVLVGWPLALRSLLLATAVALLALQLSFAVGLAYLRPTDPAEPLVPVAASPDLNHLRRTVEDLRVVRGVTPENFDVAVLVEDAAVEAVVRWALRDLPALRVVESWPADAHLVITGGDFEPALAPAGAPQGASFVATLRSGGRVPGCEPAFPPVCSYPLAWYLYRTTPHLPERELVILWQQAP
jgi:hypothetical protein